MASPTSLIGAKVQEARIAAGLLPNDLADLVGIERRQFLRIEGGLRNILPLELYMVAKHTNKSIEWFLGVNPLKGY
jgi:transcriptional regulator with XRE-family HTH domain